MVTSKFSPEGTLLWQQVYHQSEDSLWDSGETLCYNNRYVFAMGETGKTIDCVSLTILVYDRTTGEEVFVILMDKPGGSGYGSGAIEPLDDGFYFLGFTFDTTLQGEFNHLGRVRVPDITIGTEHAVQTKEGVQVYPNPSNSMLTIEHIDVALFSSIQVLNPLGQLVLDRAVNQEKEQVETPEGPEGLYQLVLKGDGVSMSKKVVVVRQ